MTDPSDGLIFGCVLDGKGGARDLDWDGIDAWAPSDGVLWVHFDRTGDRAERWMRANSGIDPAAVETLLQPAGNRPRVERYGEALLVLLRGVNLNPGADPEDMVIVHIWVEANRIITLRRRNLRAGVRVKEALDRGDGPKDASGFLPALVDRLLEPTNAVLDDLDERVDDIGRRIFSDDYTVLRRELLGLRELAIDLRRHLSPQRDAMRRLPDMPAQWLGEVDRHFLREDAEQVARFVEDLDQARERATVFQDELSSRIAERTNRTMYVLTVLSALVLPAALLTGLFGINVAGMPWVKDESGFWFVLAGIPVLAVVEYLMLRWLRLL
ncbi:MAG: zinc transporter ZntB [Bauldia litoralis]